MRAAYPRAFASFPKRSLCESLRLSLGCTHAEWSPLCGDLSRDQLARRMSGILEVFIQYGHSLLIDRSRKTPFCQDLARLAMRKPRSEARKRSTCGAVPPTIGKFLKTSTTGCYNTLGRPTLVMMGWDAVVLYKALGSTRSVPHEDDAGQQLQKRQVVCHGNQG